jgi:hypothetical protein
VEPAPGDGGQTCGRRAARRDRDVARRAIEQHVHRAQHRRRRIDAKRLQRPAERAARRNECDCGLHVVFATVSPSRTRAPATRRPSISGAIRVGVVHEMRAGAIGGQRHRPVEAIRMASLVVVPDGAAGEPVRRDARKELACGRRRLDFALWQVQFIRHVHVSPASDQIVRGETRAQGQPGTLREAIGADEEGQRPHEMRRDTRPGAALVDLFADFADVPRLQRSESAVNRALIRRKPAPEIGAPTRSTESRGPRHRTPRTDHGSRRQSRAGRSERRPARRDLSTWCACHL